ncbi:MAG: DNA primase [Paracoccaceae bacterium]|nr:MAG: DNA primase [Paracoccaceae bacterium]
MALPDGFLDELRGRLSLAQIVARKVNWDRRKSQPGRGIWWACCPFHNEKTPSFKVDDNSGRFYCFGCQAKGDAIGFVMQTENLGFLEAVEALAREAGMTMPARDPQAAARAEARAGLFAVMEEAVRFYRLQLRTARAQKARDYLAGRGLGEEALARFEIGYAPADGQALAAALTARGIAVEDLQRAGLVSAAGNGRAPRDRFRDRIMFPIRDGQGRAIAFGGRALDPGAPAKYLNSPDTELFDKGRCLYNLHTAREAAGRAGGLIVAEGYMDVIALAQAGFEHAVAPLGTAITEEQLRLMWRIADEPVIALDGDRAGLDAARRLIDRALPLLEPGRSLRFATLPPGQDPDDLIRAGGAQAMQAVIDAAQPMIDLLWARETEDRPLDTPEQRAAFELALRRIAARIAHPALRAHYADALRARARALLRPPRPDGMRGPRRHRGTDGATPAARASALARGDLGPAALARPREAAILMGCINHPDIAAEIDHLLERVNFRNPDLEALRRTLLAALPDCLGQPDPAESLRRRIGAEGIAALAAIPAVAMHPHLRPDAPAERARLAVADALELHRAELGLDAEMREAIEVLRAGPDEIAFRRVREAAQARNRVLERAGSAAKSATVAEDRVAADLQSWLDNQIWVRKRR